MLILCLLYDTGARVSELLDLTVGDIHFGRYARVQLTGKGKNPERYRFQQKQRICLKIISKGKTYPVQKNELNS